jgi:DNA-binding transcriptional MocR family regulator
LLAELGRKTHQEIGSQWELLDLGAYPPETGLERHRKIMASWCTELGVPATEETITITSGAQEALHAIILALARKGSPIMTEALTMVALKNLCGVLGTPIIGVDTDGDGVTPHALEACAARSGARLVILFADLQLPTGLRMSQERRLAIAEIARKRDLLVVEYDAYAGWARRTFPSFSELLPERALHLHSLSDVTMPGLGCGVLHSPIELGNQITRVRHATVLATSSLVCEVATRWVSSGAARRTLEAHRNEIIARQNIAAEFFPVELEAAVPGCPFIWISAGTWRAGDLVAEASASGVEVLAGERFQVSDAQPPNAIRMAISSPPDQGILY